MTGVSQFSLRSQVILIPWRCQAVKDAETPVVWLVYLGVGKAGTLISWPVSGQAQLTGQGARGGIESARECVGGSRPLPPPYSGLTNNGGEIPLKSDLGGNAFAWEVDN